MEDDEYELSPQDEPQPSHTPGKSMKAIYEQLQGQQEHKSKKIKKE